MAINKVGIVGGGLMGHGIAQICAQAGWDVVLREVDSERAAKGVGMIEKQLSRAVDKGRMEQSEAVTRAPLSALIVPLEFPARPRMQSRSCP